MVRGHIVPNCSNFSMATNNTVGITREIRKEYSADKNLKGYYSEERDKALNILDKIYELSPESQKETIKLIDVYNLSLEVIKTTNSWMPWYSKATAVLISTFNVVNYFLSICSKSFNPCIHVIQ